MVSSEGACAAYYHYGRYRDGGSGAAQPPVDVPRRDRQRRKQELKSMSESAALISISSPAPCRWSTTSTCSWATAAAER